MTETDKIRKIRKRHTVRHWTTTGVITAAMTLMTTYFSNKTTTTEVHKDIFSKQIYALRVSDSMMQIQFKSMQKDLERTRERQAFIMGKLGVEPKRNH
jgi:hypothetical protein